MPATRTPRRTLNSVEYARHLNQRLHGVGSAMDDDRYWDDQFAAHEREQERAAYAAKAARDRALAADDRPHVHTAACNHTPAAAPAKPAAAKGKGFAAKYPSFCQTCRTDIAVGERIEKATPKGYRHIECPAAAPAAPAYTEDEAQVPAPRPVRMASDRQINLIETLQAERAEPIGAPEGLTAAEASTEIERLIAMPKVKGGRRIELNGLPEGRYAVNNEDGELAFYVVTTRGVFVQASDTLHAIPGAAAEQSIIAKILVNPGEASRAYGRELGCCGVCGRTLTKKESREDGIGPVCAGKTGF